MCAFVTRASAGRVNAEGQAQVVRGDLVAAELGGRRPALRTRLGTLGIKVPATGNRWPVDPVTIRKALARRATTDLDDDGELS